MIRFAIGPDLFPMLAATLAAVGCGLIGNFLVLRRLSLMGDAISHSVLPGLVIAFLVASSRSPLAMFLGAALSGLATVALVEVVKKLGRVEPGAAMGVVFSVLFALGVLLIEGASARHIDLDADCVLHGQLETLAWYSPPADLEGLLRWSTLAAVPRQVLTLAAMTLLCAAFVALFFKELRLAAFDPELATALGFGSARLHALLMALVAVATVASFEAVGSILVIAMLICPAATARLLTDRLLTQLVVSVVIALFSGVFGYLSATSVPALAGLDAVNAAGSITLLAGALLALAIVASPRHGVITRLIRRRRLAGRVELEDLLGALYRGAEAPAPASAPAPHAPTRRSNSGSMPGSMPASMSRAMSRSAARAIAQGLVRAEPQGLRLTDRGRSIAADVVRRHRLWEHYLVDQAGMAPDHVHDPAEQLEHLPTQPPAVAATDPHGREIPPPASPR